MRIAFLLIAGLALLTAADRVTLSAQPGGAVAPGGSVEVAVELRVIPGWHVYWRNPGDSGMPPRLVWTLPPGWSAGEPRFPAPERHVESGLVTFVHHDRLVLPVRLTAPDDAVPGRVRLGLHAEWLVCQEACVPGSADLTVEVEVASGAAAIPLPAVAGALAALPGTPEQAGLRISVQRSVDGLLLRVAGRLPDPPRHPVVPQAEGVFVLDPPAPRREDGDWIIPMPLERGVAPPERVAGLLTGVPGVPAVAFDVAVGSAAPPAGIGLIAALGAGLLGGLILNLMPCVLPVLALKALAFARLRASGRSPVAESLLYAAGVVAAWLALAVVLLILRAAGVGLGWGFQLQEPAVVLALAVLFLLVAANLGGLFEVGLAATRLGGSRGGAFANGVLATVAATPCGAPFASAALGFAVAAPAGEALAVFAALGLGLAAPVLLLAAIPAAARLIPRPGPWLEDFKRVLAIPMLGAAGWMLWTFAALAGADAAFPVLVVLVPAVVLLAGAYGRWQAGASGAARLGILAGLATAAVAWWVLSAPPAAVPGTATAWQPWSAQRERELRAAGTPMLIDFTAAWCLTCQVNKRTALHDPGVLAEAERRGVVLLRADFTARDPAVAAALAARSRASVPTYILVAGDGREEVLPDVLTTGIVNDAFTTIPIRSSP